jgi:KUP system potassium uptake protein
VKPKTDSQTHAGTLPALVLAAIGVVFGDIGTSPLYTMKEAFRPGHGLAINADNVIGALSMVFWVLMLVVSFKYVLFILRADNKGEGGMLALTALTQRVLHDRRKLARLALLLGVFGAALFYGDGVITPAISVLSAVEGLEVAAPALHPYIVPVSLAVLTGLFFVQRHGTARIGAWFGPIVLLWFLVLAVLGAIAIARMPAVLAALNPLHAFTFFWGHGLTGFFALGTVVLAITGAEALYADMGHFGRRPIQVGWSAIVLPALTLNYFGQGALLLSDPETVRNPFYLLAPDWLLYPLVALATAATIIASQAVITGAFSVTRAAVQLGFLPRVPVIHTSEALGQVYIPVVNWALFVIIVLLVLLFRSSGGLASAYGIAVTTDMIITTTLALAVMVWHWKLPWYLMIFPVMFYVNDITFFAANIIKVADGGWFPLAIAAFIFLLMTTWKRGRETLYRRIKDNLMPLDPFLESLKLEMPARVPGTAVFLSAQPDMVPHALIHNLKHNKVLHERVVILTIEMADIPRVDRSERLQVREPVDGVWRVVARLGFKDEPNVPALLRACGAHGLEIDPLEVSYFLSRETLLVSKRRGMARWRRQLFFAMARNAESAMEFFRLPTNRVIELGAQIEI